MSYTADQIKAIRKLPLRKDVRWLDLSWLTPGLVVEELKRPAGEEGGSKWAAIDLKCPDCAAKTVAAHNEWLAAQPAPAEPEEADDDL